MALLLTSGSQLAPARGMRRRGKVELREPHLGNHGLNPLDQSPAEPAEGERDRELLLRESLGERMTGGSWAGH